MEPRYMSAPEYPDFSMSKISDTLACRRAPAPGRTPGRPMPPRRLSISKNVRFMDRAVAAAMSGPVT